MYHRVLQYGKLQRLFQFWKHWVAKQIDDRSKTETIANSHLVYLQKATFQQWSNYSKVNLTLNVV